MIHLYNKDKNLGHLTFENNYYVWTPNLKNIEQALYQNRLGMEMFFLPITQTRFESVPAHFEDYLFATERFDIKTKAGIKVSDSDFEKLIKVSKLNFSEVEFYIKSE